MREGILFIKSTKKKLEKDITQWHETSTYTGRKLGLSFQINNQVIFEHKHDIIYYGKCLAENCVDDYLGETACRINERIVDHTGRDTNFHPLKHSTENGHKSLEYNKSTINTI